MEQKVASLPNPAGTLEARLGALETGLREAASEARTARAAATAAGQQAAEALGRPAPASSTDPGLGDAVAVLGTRVDDVARQAVANRAAAGDLGTRLDALGTRLTDGLAAGATALGAVQGGFAPLRNDLGALRSTTTTLETRSAEAAKTLAGLSGDMTRTSGEVTRLSGDLARTAGEVTRVSGDVAKLSPAAVQAGLRVVVAGRLDDALRTGAPLGPVLAALEKLGAEPAPLGALRPFAATAPAGAGALAAEFKPLAAQMTAVPAEPGESIADRVRRLFGKVVTVKAVGDGSGADLPGLVGRIEAALARAALPEAATLWDGLPEPAKRVSAEWAARLKARVAAEEASRRLVAQSLSALDAATR